MKYSSKATSFTLGLTMALSLAMGTAQAAKPEHAGNNGKGKSNASHMHKPAKSQAAKPAATGSAGTSVNLFFGDNKRDIIRDYYSGQFKSGHCPPGLAKKNNGCQPPGQAKKWRRGYPLPHDVIYHDLPDDLLRRLGRTEEGYKLVRVGTDILKIGIGTGLVIEAVEDLGGLF